MKKLLAGAPAIWEAFTSGPQEWHCVECDGTSFEIRHLWEPGIGALMRAICKTCGHTEECEFLDETKQ